ncbi:polyadenylate-binding protein-interacting protein 2 [Trichogramma pretiosum]|uniref:Ataxin-2 C-terminal domain-containing protein n=1 Tax=Trichogramma kaykai TaxID=54128 RepID=A0ABD2WFY5_9HYME|nr:polyadenylate-binding protein-interacting protein 2 [Trichogramma pretiosum]XP_014221666.1 polyadenylate-binding protein-interacting protein 2 [Trichogramma pretiosum]
MNMKIHAAPSETGCYGLEIPSMDFVYEGSEPESESTTSATPDNDFSDYLWMADEEEHDSNFMRDLEERELMRVCEEQHRMDQLQDELDNACESIELSAQLDNLRVDVDIVNESTLNPEAAEFVPNYSSTQESNSESS